MKNNGIVYVLKVSTSILFKMTAVFDSVDVDTTPVNYDYTMDFVLSKRWKNVAPLSTCNYCCYFRSFIAHSHHVLWENFALSVSWKGAVLSAYIVAVIQVTKEEWNEAVNHAHSWKAYKLDNRAFFRLPR